MRKIKLTFNGEELWAAEWADRAPVRKQQANLESAISETMKGQMVIDELTGATNIVRDCLRSNIDQIRKAQTVAVDEAVAFTMGALLPFLNEKYGATEVNFWTKETQGYELAGVNVLDHKGELIKSVADNPVLLSE